MGLEYAVTRSYDCIILDVMLPGKNGFEICEEIRKSPKAKKTPIIMATAK
ncbi:MAG: response regulator [Candidatus Peribacteria bacterium]|nr:MAG: response regulator [Candidatus Peribacteria bacterium]